MRYRPDFHSLRARAPQDARQFVGGAARCYDIIENRNVLCRQTAGYRERPADVLSSLLARERRLFEGLSLTNNQIGSQGHAQQALKRQPYLHCLVVPSIAKSLISERHRHDALWPGLLTPGSQALCEQLTEDTAVDDAALVLESAHQMIDRVGKAERAVGVVKVRLAPQASATQRGSARISGQWIATTTTCRTVEWQFLSAGLAHIERDWLPLTATQHTGRREHHLYNN